MHSNERQIEILKKPQIYPRSSEDQCSYISDSNSGLYK